MLVASEQADSTTRGHEPGVVARQIASQEATAGRHVVVLLGAGTSCAAGVPDLAHLTKLVRDRLRSSDRNESNAWLERGDLEFVLSRLRTLSRVLASEDRVGGLGPAELSDLEKAVTGAIVEQLVSAEVDPKVFDGLAAWALRQQRSLPLEVFTLNYDLLVEDAFERLGVEYTDGFVGALRAPFNSRLVDDRIHGSEPVLPASFVRFWKLHGSINWAYLSTGEVRTVVRTGQHVAPDEVAAIYPSDEKYSEARRVPFLVLHDRFRRSLATPETLMLISGYSFGDDHLNEVIFAAAGRTRRSTFAVFCYSKIPEELAERAMITPNLMVTTPDEAIIGGRRGPWHGGEEIPGVFENGRFLLGSFRELSGFLGSLSKVDGGE